MREGVALARAGESRHAMRKYAAALKIHPDCIEAYVARGAE